MMLHYLCGGKPCRTSGTDERVRIDTAVSGLRTTVTVTALEDITLSGAEITFAHIYRKSDTFFVNGYQSWTDTREYRYNESLRDVLQVPAPIRRKYAFANYGEQFMHRCEKGVFHGFDLAYIRGRDPLFIGSYNYKNAYLIIEFRKTENTVCLRSDAEGVSLRAGESFILYDYVTESRGPEAMKDFFAGMRPRTERKLFGYTSWYNHYQNISEEIILSALEKSDPRFELFQIDDGFEPFVGDWLSVDRKKFPNGLQPIVKAIHGRGMLAGIWLAPFAAERSSALFREHPDWLCRGTDGRPIMAGSNWSGFAPLSLDCAPAMDYVRTVLKTYTDLGFDFFKLDFLYAPMLGGMKGKSRAQAADFAYGLLRECLGEKLILGSGANIANGFGRFDFMRVGPDVSLKFDDVFYMHHMHRERISTKVTLQNTIFRSPMDGHAFLNDPDVFLLRDNNISLSPQQRYALTTLNALFGSLMMTSDNPADYDAEKTAVLDRALELFRGAEVLSYEPRGKTTAVSYRLNGQTDTIVYDTERGVFIDG